MVRYSHMVDVDNKIITNILYSIRDNLVSKGQLEKKFRDVLQDKYSESIIANLRRRKDILYVFKGFYYIVSPEEKIESYIKYTPSEMIYTILNKLNIQWYLGLESALEKNNLIWQSIVHPVILNSEISGEKKILKITYHFHKMKRNLLKFGFLKKKTKNRITYYYSNPEKTYIDYIYFQKNPPSELQPFKKNEKTISYLKKYYSKSFKKKVLYS